jgi:hypothetical protein
MGETSPLAMRRIAAGLAAQQHEIVTRAWQFSKQTAEKLELDQPANSVSKEPGGCAQASPRNSAHGLKQAFRTQM